MQQKQDLREAMVQTFIESADKGVNLAVLVSDSTSTAKIKPFMEKYPEKLVVNIDIMLDSDMLKEHQVELVFVGPDNETAAKTVGDVLAKELGKDGKVIIIEGVEAAMNAQQRKQGFLKSIDEHGLELLACGIANWETEQAFSVFSSLLEQNPEVQGVMCANDAMAIGVIRVLEAAGKAGQVKVIGFDNDDSAGPLIKDDKMLATIDCFGSQMAAEGINYAMKALQGEKHKGWIRTKMELICN